MGDDYLAMFHHLFFVMSLSGSVVFLVYGLTYPIARKYFSQSWRKRILCSSLFFYLVPLPLFKAFTLSRLKIAFPFPHESVPIDLEYTIQIQNDQYLLGSGVIMAGVFVFCIIVIAAIIIIRQLRRYLAIYRTYMLKEFYEIPSGQLEGIFLLTKEELRIKKPVRLICSKLCDAPVTIGVFSPTIVLPPVNKIDLSFNDYKFILKHELLHIKNKDLLLKFLAFFALALHWYNPICYLLYFELCMVSEMSCDCGVIKDAGDSQRQQYSRLILNLAAACGSRKGRFEIGLVNHGAAAFERRILEIKKAGRNTSPILSCIVMVFVCIAGTITSFSYGAPQGYRTEDIKREGEVTFSASDGTESIEPLPFDYFFTDQEGHIMPLDHPAPHPFCVHEYMEEHIKSSEGGCGVAVRSAKRCKSCGYTMERDVISESAYTACPHEGKVESEVK